MTTQQTARSEMPRPLDLLEADVNEKARRRAALRSALRWVREEHVRTGRVKDRDLGDPTVEEVEERHAFMATVVAADIAAGSTRHRRLPRGWRCVPLMVAVLDWAVLFTFLASVFNVRLDAPVTTPVATLAATALAVIGSGPAYVWLALTGERLRTFRGPLGEIRWSLVAGTTRLMLAVSMVLIAALAALMTLRVFSEAWIAADIVGQEAARPLGIAFAVFSVVANLTVIAVHALDGSVEGDELRHAGRLLRRQEQALHRRHRATVRAQGGLVDPMMPTWDDDRPEAGSEGDPRTA